jgi:acyl-CoA thioester hydrolase
MTKTFAAPLPIHTAKVSPSWIDYNGHMNVAYYVLAFDNATDKLCDLLDIGVEHLKRDNGSIFTLDLRVNYLREVKAGDPLSFDLQLLDFDAKRMHVFMRMFHATEGYLSATEEFVTLHVDMTTRRSAPFPDKTLAMLEALKAAHAGLPTPPNVGRGLTLRRAT